MSDQTLMEMLIEGFDDETKKRYQDKKGMYFDVCEWSCVACDEDQRVIHVDMKCRYIGGSLELCYVPPKVRTLRIGVPWVNTRLKGSVNLTHLPKEVQVIDLRINELTGEIDLTQLPQGMLCLHLQDNQFCGKVDLMHLPSKIKELYLCKNKLTGEIDLSQLPEAMEKLFFTRNQLTGSVDLTQLPDRMQKLYLEHNQLTGRIDLTHLPDGMKSLSLSNNQLTEGLDFAQLPQGMEELYLENNQLSGSFVVNKISRPISINAQRNNFNPVAVVYSKTRARIFLRGSGVTSVVDEDGREQDTKWFLW